MVARSHDGWPLFSDSDNQQFLLSSTYSLLGILQCNYNNILRVWIIIDRGSLHTYNMLKVYSIAKCSLFRGL